MHSSHAQPSARAPRSGGGRASDSPAHPAYTPSSMSVEALKWMAALGGVLSEAVFLLGTADDVVYLNERAATMLGGSAVTGNLRLPEVLRRLAELDAAPSTALDRLLHLCRRADPTECERLAPTGRAPLTVRTVPLGAVGASRALTAVVVESGDTPAPRPLDGPPAGVALADALATNLDYLSGAIHALAHSWQARDGGLVAEEIARLSEGADVLRRAASALSAVMGMSAGVDAPASTELDISDLLMAIMPRWKPRAPRHSFELALAGETPRVSAVEPLVTLALDCLLQAATAWTPQGGVVRVTLRASRGGASVAVRPYTAGPYLGPRPEGLASPPAPMEVQMGDTLARAQLGLALARAIVETHGGHLATEHSTAGGTAALVAQLPCEGPALERLGEPSAATPGGASEALGPRPRAGRQTVVVWEPDARTLRYLRANFEPRGFRVATAPSVSEVARLVELEEPDAVLFDVGDVEEQAKNLVADLRALTGAPLLALTRRYDAEQCATLLDAGASDYLGKPFSVDELMARLRVALRAHQSVASDAGAERIVRTGDLCVDLAQRVVTVGDAEVRLSKTEFKLLRVLAQHLGTVLAHEMLLERVWGAGYTQESDFVWVYVRRLRRKIEPDPAHPRYVVTVPGVGYRLARLPAATPQDAAIG